MAADSSEPWWELRVAVPSALAEDAGAIFVADGALGCEQLSSDAPAPVFANEPKAVTPAAPLGETTLVVSFAGSLAREEVEALAVATLASIGLGLHGLWQITWRTDTDWAVRWKEYFRPLQLGPTLWVVPSWNHEFHAPADARVITLDPGMAFGTGQHATTALCVELLEAGFADADARAARLLDVGCGSGILAIAAALLGCPQAVAVDNDPVAVTVAHENIAQNGVGDAVRASGEDLAQIPGRFDWVVANIISPTLIELAVPLVTHTEAGGALVLSGILANQEAEVVAAITHAAAACGRDVPALIARRQRDEWVALRLRV